MTSVPSKLPLTNAFATRPANERSSSIRRAPPPPPAANTNSPVLVSRNTNKSLKRKNAAIKEDEQVPVNVDEVAMINNIKEETERYNASSSQDESLVEKKNIYLYIFIHNIKTRSKEYLSNFYL